jgi:chromosome segregation ATPase
MQGESPSFKVDQENAFRNKPPDSKELMSYRQELRKLELLLSREKASNANLETKIKECQLVIQDLEQQKAAANRAKVQATDESRSKSKLEEKVKELMEKNAQLNLDIRNLKAKYQETVAQASTSIESWRAANESLIQEKTAAGNAAKLEKSLREELETKVESLTNQVSTEQHRVATLERDLETLRASRDQFNTENTRLIGELERKEVLLSKANADIFTLREKSSENEVQLESRIRTLESELHLKQGTISELTASNRFLKTAQEDMVSRFTSELEAGKTAFGMTRALSAELETKALEAKAQASKLLEYEAKVAELEASSLKTNQRNLSLESLLKESDRQRAELQQERDTLRSTLDVAESTVLQLKESLTLMGQQSKATITLHVDTETRLQKSLIEWQMKYSNAQDTMKALRESLHAEQEKSRSLQSLSGDVDCLAQERIQLQNTVDSLKHAVGVLEQEKIEIQDRFTSEVFNLKQELEQSRIAGEKSLAHSEASNTTLQNQLLELQRKLCEQDSIIDGLQRCKADLTTRFDQIRDDNTITITNLKQMTSAAEELRTALQEARNAASSRHDEAHSLRQQLQASADDLRQQLKETADLKLQLQAAEESKRSLQQEIGQMVLARDQLELLMKAKKESETETLSNLQRQIGLMNEQHKVLQHEVEVAQSALAQQRDAADTQIGLLKADLSKASAVAEAALESLRVCQTQVTVLQQCRSDALQREMSSLECLEDSNRKAIVLENTIMALNFTRETLRRRLEEYKDAYKTVKAKLERSVLTIETDREEFRRRYDAMRRERDEVLENFDRLKDMYVQLSGNPAALVDTDERLGKRPRLE